MKFEILGSGRPRATRVPLYVHEHGPAVDRLRAPARNEVGVPSPASLAWVRQALCAGRCQLRITRPAQRREAGLSALVLFAWDLDDPDGIGTVAVPGYLFSQSKPWVPVAFLDRKLQVQAHIVAERALLRQRTALEWLSAMDPYVSLVHAFLADLRDPRREDWEQGWFVSRLGSCAMCGRDLTDIQSQSRGVGPECFDILCELPAVRTLGAVLAGKSDAETAAAWNRGVEVLVRMGLAKTEARDYTDVTAALAERDERLAAMERLKAQRVAESDAFLAEARRREQKAEAAVAARKAVATRKAAAARAKAKAVKAKAAAQSKTTEPSGGTARRPRGEAKVARPGTSVADSAAGSDG